MYITDIASRLATICYLTVNTCLTTSYPQYVLCINFPTQTMKNYKDLVYVPGKNHKTLNTNKNIVIKLLTTNRF